MKILIVNTSDIDGGAARAAYRLHRALLANHIDSQMLVMHKKSDDPTVILSKTPMRRFRRKIDSLPIRRYIYRTKTLFSAAWLPFSNIVEQINEINPDVVHLHWIVGGMIRIEDLANIKAPIVWSLHDMWPLTGGCHYDETCGKYIDTCGKCPVLASKHVDDLSHSVWKRKHSTYTKLPNLTIIGLSRWITECAQNSSLFKNRKIVNLPNIIDTNSFHPIDKRIARESWKLPLNKKLILFGAINSTSDPRKGFHNLQQALDLSDNTEVELVIFGSSESIESNTFTIHNVGHVHDDDRLTALYSAADVMIVPSLQENLSNAILESLSCGTPVVAFDIGGNSDMIDHKSNGYLAKPFDSIDLADGIKWILDAKNYYELCNNARCKIEGEYNGHKVLNTYKNMYIEAQSV